MRVEISASRVNQSVIVTDVMRKNRVCVQEVGGLVSTRGSMYRAIKTDFNNGIGRPPSQNATQFYRGQVAVRCGAVTKNLWQRSTVIIKEKETWSRFTSRSYGFIPKTSRGHCLQIPSQGPAIVSEYLAYRKVTSKYTMENGYEAK